MCVDNEDHANQSSCSQRISGFYSDDGHHAGEDCYHLITDIR